MASGRLIDYLGSGLRSVRPALLDLTAGSVGIFFATDEDTMYLWAGNAWHTLTVSGSAAWGSLTGNINNQTDLKAALDAKLADAPSDTKLYGRKGAAWTEVVIPAAYTPKNVFAISIPVLTANAGEYARVAMPYAGSLATAGVSGSVGVNPAAALTFTVFKGATSIGTIVVSAAGVITPALTTTAFAAGDILILTGGDDASAKNITLTFKMS